MGSMQPHPEFSKCQKHRPDSDHQIHRLSGISSPANAAYSLTELEYQLRSSGSKVLFTCQPLLPIALEAASKCDIPKDRVYLLEVPEVLAGGQGPPKELKTVNQLIKEGASLPELEELRWEKGQGARQTAFLCYSSGTSGLPKGVMISHRNVIANTLQIATFESPYRERRRKPGDKNAPTEVVLGLLPQSHIYALVVICHASIYRGDQVINLPKFEIHSYLNAIQRFKINGLYLVSNRSEGGMDGLALAANLRCDRYHQSSLPCSRTSPYATSTTWAPLWASSRVLLLSVKKQPRIFKSSILHGRSGKAMGSLKQAPLYVPLLRTTSGLAPPAVLFPWLKPVS